MFSFFKNKKNTQEPIKNDEIQTIVSTDLSIQSQWLVNNGWLKENYDKNKKTILIMDDREEIISSILDDLKSLERSGGFFINDYNVLTVFTKMAGFDVLRIIDEAKEIEIHYALLDIILGGKKLFGDKRKMIDGVDVAINLYERFNYIDILFFTGCIVDNSNDPTNFKNKFEKFMGDSISKYMMPKDIPFDEEIKRLSAFFNGF
jgi:hypothetical protein